MSNNQTTVQTTVDIYVEVNLPSCPYHGQIGKVVRDFKNFKDEVCYEVYLMIEDEFALFNERVLQQIKG